MVSNLIKNGTSILYRRQKSILSAAAAIMVIGLLSRLLGLVRDRLLAHYFGASPELGVYFAATRIPNMIFDLLIAGSLSSAFIPVFTILLKKNRRQAWEVTSSVIGAILLIYFVSAILFFLFAQPISKLIAPGFSPPEIALMVRLSRIMLGAQVFFILANFLTGILQSFQRFFLPALSLSFYNLGIILGTIFLVPRFGIYGPAVGVVLGAFLFFAAQLPLAKSLGFRFRIGFNLSHPQVKEIGRLMLPRTLGLAVNQIDATVDVILASLISTPSLVIFSFAQHLQFVPVGLFGAAIGQAALPTLSSELTSKDKEAFKSTFVTSLHQMFFFVIPASVIFFVLRIPMVRLVFGAARFDWLSTMSTGYTLAFFALSIAAQSSVYLSARAFYALHDTATPVKISLISVALNTILSIFFTQSLGFGVWSLGLSASIASLLNASLLLFFLDRQVGIFERHRLLIPFLKISFASVIMGICLYIPMKLLDALVFDTTRVVGLILLTGTATLAGTSVYLILTLLLRVEEVAMIWRLARKVRDWRKESHQVIEQSIFQDSELF